MEKVLKSVWRQFVQTGNVNSELIRPIIFESWTACRATEIDPFSKRVTNVLSQQELEARRVKNQDFILVSLPVMRNLCSFVQGSGFIVVLADAEGYLLEITGDEDVINNVKAGNFVVGSDWSEKNAGTNAVGTALRKDMSIQISGYEHYCTFAHNSTCSAATIHDQEGRVLGVINATAAFDKAHPHTLGMVATAAKAIENELRLQEDVFNYQLANNYKNIMESIAVGIFVCNQNGDITRINDAAARILGLNKVEVLGKNVNDFWRFENGSLKQILLQGKEVTNMEIEIHFDKQRRSSCQISSRALINQNKVPEGLVVIMSEITRARSLVHRMVGVQAKVTFDDLIGKDTRFLNTIHLGKVTAGSKCNVLLLGESGTGKDIFAQAIHNDGARSLGPFVAINCGAIPRELIASELFGYTDGAFTGAKRGGNPGKFELADGGTIFLDEIGEMPLDLQTSLLRVLEQKTVTRIGGQEIIPVDVRLIAATNKDLLAEVRKGKFRKDLYYRLNVIDIELVPLRERKDDILLLTEHFVGKLCNQLNKSLLRLSSEIEDLFLNYSWPGNVRELQNVLERVVNLATSSYISVDLVPRELRPSKEPRGKTFMLYDEKESFRDLLRQSDGNITRVAQKLGVARTTVYRRLNKYGISDNVSTGMVTNNTS